MKLLVSLALLSLSISACNEEPSKGSEIEGRASIEGVRACFESYKSAILDQDGEKAVRFLSRSTIDQYQEYIDLALAAERRELETLSFINRMQVILLRHRVPLETLEDLDGRSAIVYAVNRDWIGKNGVIRTELGKIDVIDKRATAEVLIGGQKAPGRFQFRRETESWKFDLISVLQNTNTAMKAAVKQSGLEENEFLFTVLESVSGKRVDEGIWTPPK